MKSPKKLLAGLCAALAAIIAAAVLSSCSGTPVAVSYTGHAAGHNYSVGYSGKSGVGVVISQK